MTDREFLEAVLATLGPLMRAAESLEVAVRERLVEISPPPRREGRLKLISQTGGSQ